MDTVLLYLLTSKLDPETRFRWEERIEHTPFPSVEDLFNFLHGHCKVLEATKPTYQNPTHPTTYANRARVQQPKSSPEQTIRARQRAPRKHVFTATQVAPACPTCQGQYPVCRCDSFKAKTVSERLEDATRVSLCLNCLKKGYTARDCHASSCRVCGGRHHTMLHQGEQPSRSNSSTSSRSSSSSSRGTASPPSPISKRKISRKHKSGTTRTNSPPNPSDSPRRTHTHKQGRQKSRTPTKTENIRPSVSEVLCNNIVITAQVHMLTNKQQPIQCRALLGTGSSMNFITERLANTLGIRQQTCSVPIGALDTLTTTSRRFIRATITSIDGKYEHTLTFLVIPAITHRIPSQPIDRSTLHIPRNIKLADPRFHVPSPIDVLLNSGATLSSMCVGQINLTGPDEPDLCLQKTRFGWVIGGVQLRQPRQAPFTHPRRLCKQTLRGSGKSTKDPRSNTFQKQSDDAKTISELTPDAPAKDDTSSLSRSTNGSRR
ncbi:uncharacterized protein LOC112213770 [Bombus impatiens]|uniref:Uncharacterized protein LOC112213770 n=1 Tax=Bombus impatiens TaxID=132113 RepID=A0A6P8LKK2_BOMIM|nr:uncharacterized protein LOC112213770 [Bombus impatiens]